jgi:hypothetical protein
MPKLTKKPWFGPKRWGWGWRPISWQGWLVVLIYVGAVALIASVVNKLGQTKFFVAIIIISIILMVVTRLTGGKPEPESF